jgi:uncharacterized protein YprB with RNaseH-like and TPR domain
LIWTQDLDRTLTAARSAFPAAPWSEVAARVVEQTGVRVTGDAARNRFNRIAEIIELDELEQDAPALDVPAAPFDTYVGFETLFWDLETTNLTAIMGRLLACAFADGFGQTKAFRIEDYPGITPIDDSRLAVAIRDELEGADVWVTWNGKLFDIPFLNARLLKAGERPVRSDIKHVDLMYYSRGQFVRIGSSKLENVSKFVRSPNRKTPLEWDTWSLAQQGVREAMDEVVDHAIADVLVTRDVFAHLRPHIRNVHR